MNFPAVSTPRTSQAKINTLLTTLQQQIAAPTACSICGSNLTTETACILHCKHCYCVECITHWAEVADHERNGITCPYCRAYFKSLYGINTNPARLWRRTVYTGGADGETDDGLSQAERYPPAVRPPSPSIQIPPWERDTPLDQFAVPPSPTRPYAYAGADQSMPELHRRWYEEQLAARAEGRAPRPVGHATAGASNDAFSPAGPSRPQPVIAQYTYHTPLLNPEHAGLPPTANAVAPSGWTRNYGSNGEPLPAANTMATPPTAPHMAQGFAPGMGHPSPANAIRAPAYPPPMQQHMGAPAYMRPGQPPVGLPPYPQPGQQYYYTGQPVFPQPGQFAPQQPAQPGYQYGGSFTYRARHSDPPGQRRF
ncbi:hypothetical protein BT63DRAFT_449301 [Microthyrium microscopicum]|uniref:RING-type domain-containing protein n=1 Tax=Microthyrium microscopicum TaxID=703497 RepID=A0A6A6UPX1_9PEZI|nr:hypothetical protein BT63DRAFT_449301 [Microthyrium microscopicum]